MNQWREIKIWLENSSARERIGVLAATLAAIYFLVYLLLIAPLSDTSQNLASQIQKLTQQIEQQQIQTKDINNTSQKLMEASSANSTPVLEQKLAQQKEALQAYFLQLANPLQAAQAVKTLLLPTQDMVLTHLQNSPPQLLQSIVQNNSQPLYEHDIVLEFRGTYPATLDYLQRLESLPWYFFNDELKYQVEKYPTAKITIKLHILSYQENLLNV